MSKKLFYFSSGCFFLLIFFFFSYLVRQQLFVHSDVVTTAFLQKNISHVVDVPFSLLSLIGSLEVTGVFLLVFLIIRRKIRSGVVVVCFFGIIHLFELYGKIFLRHPGPPMKLLRYNLVFNFPSAYVRPGSSYPSGHAARAWFITVVIGLLALKSHRLTNHVKVLIIAGLACYDLLMCISRVYLAEHWMTDVAGGSVLGTGLALMAGVVL